MSNSPILFQNCVTLFIYLFEKSHLLIYLKTCVCTLKKIQKPLEYCIHFSVTNSLDFLLTNHSISNNFLLKFLLHLIKVLFPPCVLFILEVQFLKLKSIIFNFKSNILFHTKKLESSTFIEFNVSVKGKKYWYISCGYKVGNKSKSHLKKEIVLKWRKQSNFGYKSACSSL